MSQGDSALLAVPNELATEGPLTKITETESAILSKDECRSKMEVYVPVNAISDEVYSLIAAWEASDRSSTISSDCVNIDENSVQVSLIMIEPAQVLDDFAPPKRYHRKRRSASQRILALSSAQSKTNDLQSTV